MSVDNPTMVTGISNLVFKFDVTLDILEEDHKGFSSAARDKNCFKLRQDLRKKVLITVQQLTNKHLIVERLAIIVFIITTTTTVSLRLSPLVFFLVVVFFFWDSLRLKLIIN